ncbi:hypothetical protein AOLI_G00272540 [Acnodon oligacanthus]
MAWAWLGLYTQSKWADGWTVIVMMGSALQGLPVTSLLVCDGTNSYLELQREPHERERKGRKVGPDWHQWRWINRELGGEIPGDQGGYDGATARDTCWDPVIVIVSSLRTTGQRRGGGLSQQG